MAPISKKELAPGDSTVVELVFNTRTSKGRVTKNARVTSNDSTMAAFSIDFVATIVPTPDTLSNIRIDAPRVAFAKDSTKYEVIVENHDSSMVHLTLAAKPLDDIRADIKDDSIKPGKKGKIEFEWEGKTEPEYDVNHVVTFETGLRGITRFSVPYIVKGLKGPKPVVVPQKAQNPPSPAGTAVQKPNTSGQIKSPAANQVGTAVKSSADPGKPAVSTAKPIVNKGKPEINKEYSPDSVKVDKPLPGTEQWPPR